MLRLSLRLGRSDLLGLLRLRLVEVLLRCFKWLKVIIVFVVIVIIVVIVVILILVLRLLYQALFGIARRGCKGRIFSLIRRLMDQFHPALLVFNHGHLR